MLSQEERNQLGIKLTKVALLFGVEKTGEQISMFIQTMQEFFPSSCEKYINAIDVYCSDEKNKFFPTPVQLRGYIQGELSKRATGNEVATRIQYAISKFGYPNPKEAAEHIGELGWNYIQRLGGWEYLCQNFGVSIHTTTFHAQCRGCIESMIETSHLGIFNQPIGIPAPRSQGLLSSKEIFQGKELPQLEDFNSRRNNLLNQVKEIKNAQND